MDKLKMHSLNKVDDNIKKIGALFPNCVTERKNDAGEVEYAIDFDMLKSENVGEIVLAGKYVNDLALRFEYTDIPAEKIRCFEDINEAVNYLDSDRKEYIYAITCFSDKGKFLARVKGE